MGLYDAVKDAINLAQKADNVELYRQLLDLGAQTLELQAEVSRLKEENAQLKLELNSRKQVIRHKTPYITLEDDDLSIPYCAYCYGSKGLFIQLFDYDKTHYACCNCKNYIEKST